MTLHDRCYEIYVAEGSNDVVGVNRYLEDKYPDMAGRILAMEELEDTRLWRILWHNSSMAAGRPRDHGVVMEYLG
jgi:hypothetical protein